MNSDTRNEQSTGLLRRSWTGLVSFLRDLEPDYTEADYLAERISRLEREFADLKRSLSEKDSGHR